MSGLVFHPGHEELHGVTVVVEGTSGTAWVGRYHERTARGVVLRDVTIHDPEAHQPPRAEWIDRLRRFGIPVEHQILTVPSSEVATITRLAEWPAAAVTPPGA